MTQSIRKVPLTHGAQWLIRALNLGTRNPRAIFGAGLLVVAVLYLVLYLFTMPLRGDGDITVDYFVTVVCVSLLAVVLVLPVLLGGLMHVIREAENGRPVRARDMFAPLRQHKAVRLALLGLVQIALALLCGSVLLWATGPDFWAHDQDLVRGALGGQIAVPQAQAQYPALVVLVQLVYSYFSTAVVLVSIPLIMFSGLDTSAAVKRSFGASVWNLGSYLFAAMLFMLGAMITGALSTAVSLAALKLGSLIHPTLVQLSLVAVLVAYGSAFLVVMCGTCYYAWRDVFTDNDDAPAASTPRSPRPGELEA